MAKTLSESAAEILNASIGKNQEPAAKLAQFQDLGGATPEDDYSSPGQSGDDESEDADRADDSVGSNAAKGVNVAPRPVPGGKAAPQEPMNGVKTQGLAKPVVGDVDPAYDGGGAAVSEETETEDEVIEEVAETEIDTEAVKAETIKEMIAKHKGSMLEDVNALFNGESLSEDFRVKATLIFEAAVTSRVENILKDVLAENDEVLAAAYTELKTELSEQVDEYLNYVVEQWMEENQVAVESGLRAELSEEFITGLKDLFEKHYVEIPDEKLDVAEELASRVVDLEEQLETSNAQLADQVKSLSEELNAIKKSKAISLACEGLTQVQAGKMKSLAEGVEFTTEGDFNNKLAVIRENYFPTKVQVNSEVKAIQETSVEEPEVAQTSGLMSHYVNSITKTAPKF